MSVAGGMGGTPVVGNSRPSHCEVGGTPTTGMECGIPEAKT